MADFRTFCEYTENPLGIGTAHPRLSWRLDSGADQTAYAVEVKNEQGTVVFERQCQSAENLCRVETALESSALYTWRVQLTLADGTSITSPEGHFETALLDGLKGDYIAFAGYEKRKSPYFLRKAEINRPVKRARAYVSGLGYYELTLNGRKVGNTSLCPGWTDYNKRVLYDTYDITSFLLQGKNAIGVQLGEGWFGHEHIFFQQIFGTNPSWYNDPCLKMTVLITYQDGTQETILTAADGTWLCAQSPIIMNNVFDGETYDARLEIEGWNTPDFVPDERFTPAVCAKNPPKGISDTTVMPPIREHDLMRPTEVHRPGVYTVTYDFGLNIAGWVKLRVRGPKGAKVVVRYGESMKADKTVNQMNLREAKSCDTYILKGEYVEEYYKPRFTYHGFRFAEVTIDEGVHLLGCEAYRVNNSLHRAGHFECSEPMLNKIYQAIINTEMNNEHSLPTDCPQRDERLGWINDVTVRYEQTMFNFDAQLFFEKWLNDIADSQTLQESGAIGDTAPFFYGGFPACHISSVYVQLPYRMYLFNGDKSVLERFYDGMNRYARFKLTTLDENGLVHVNYAGDWAPPLMESEFGHSCDAMPANIGKQIISTGYVYYDCLTMAECARIMGKEEEAEFYLAKAEEVKSNINSHCLDRENGCYIPCSQGSNLFPLFLDIVPEDQKDRVVKHLLDDLMITNNGHITTGNQTTKYLFAVLDKLGRNDIGVELLKKEDYPSFGYMFACGGTTIWERFENSTGVGMNSHNHPMHGSFSVWYYKSLAGIDPARHEGNVYIIQPDFVHNLDYVSASHETVHGVLASQWKREDGRIVLNVTVPWSCRAEVVLKKGSVAVADGAPAQEKILLSSGRHEIIVM